MPDRRIVLAYTMAVGGRRISASLATVEIVPEGDGTRLTFTEQGVHLDGVHGPGPDAAAGREEGTSGLLDKVAALFVDA